MNDASETAPQVIELTELPAAGAPGKSILNGNLGMVQNVKTKLAVMAGEAELTLGELMALHTDQVVALDRLTDEALDIVLDGQVIARGQLVAVGDHFGVRILEVPDATAP
jgi:flagellar motor switch protein FliN/FliY